MMNRNAHIASETVVMWVVPSQTCRTLRNLRDNGYFDSSAGLVSGMGRRGAQRYACLTDRIAGVAACGDYQFDRGFAARRRNFKKGAGNREIRKSEEAARGSN
jgi:hypothetical protein